MKHFYLILTLTTAIAMSSCNGGGMGKWNHMPASSAGYSDEEKEEIMNRNNPLRQGLTYFYSKTMGYSVQYPNSFVDFKKDGDKGFSCKSKDGYATLKAWGEKASGEIEDLVANTLSNYNKQGAKVNDTDLEDDSFVIEGDFNDRHFYHRTIMLDGEKCATLYFEYKPVETDDFDAKAVYASVGPELGETLIAGVPPVAASPSKPAGNVVAQVAYVGEWNTFSTMRSEVEIDKKYPEFKDVNTWEASTDGKEVYLIMAADEDTKITVKNTKTGERLYNNDSRPLIVRCNDGGLPNAEITFITDKGKIVRYVPSHDGNNNPATTSDISSMNR